MAGGFSPGARKNEAENGMRQIESTYKILSSDCDRHGFWRMNSVMVLMQELAGEHSILLGCGRKDTLQFNAVWILTRHEMVIDRYPEIAQTVVGKSFPGRPRRGIFPRYYLIEDGRGRPLARGSSFWVLADVNTRQMLPECPPVTALMPDTSGLTVPLHNPGAAEEVSGGLRRDVTWKPLFTDFDQNGHVNNTRAADWALCFLGEEAPVDKTPVHTLRVSYHRELLPGNPVELSFGLRERAFSLRCDALGEVALRLSGTLYDREIQPGE